MLYVIRDNAMDSAMAYRPGPWGGGGGQSTSELWFSGQVKWVCTAYRILIEYLIAFDKVNDKLHDIPEEYRISAIWK